MWNSNLPAAGPAILHAEEVLTLVCCCCALGVMLGQISRWLSSSNFGHPFTLVINKVSSGEVNSGGVSLPGASWFLPPQLAARYAKWHSTCFLRHMQLLLCYWHCGAEQSVSKLTDKTWLSKDGGIMGCQKDNWQVCPQVPGFLHPGGQHRKKPPSIQKSLVGLTSLAFPAWMLLLHCLKAVAAFGVDEWGGMWKQLLCQYSCFGMALRIPGHINSPLTPFKTSFWAPALRSKMGLFWTWNTPMEESCMLA